MKRRLAIVDANGATIRSMDISDIAHANTMATMSMRIETQCEFGEWHIQQEDKLFPWGERMDWPR